MSRELRIIVDLETGRTTGTACMPPKPLMLALGRAQRWIDETRAHMRRVEPDFVDMMDADFETERTASCNVASLVQEVNHADDRS